MSNPPLTSSPWGRPDSQINIADGIASISTPSHGGIWLSQKRYDSLPKALQCNPYGGSTFFEEDLEAMIIIYYFDIEPVDQDYSYFNTEKYQSVYDYFTTNPNRESLGVFRKPNESYTIIDSIPFVTTYPVTLTSVFVSNGGRMHTYIDQQCGANDCNEAIITRAFEALEINYDPVVEELRHVITLYGETTPLKLNLDQTGLLF